MSIRIIDLVWRKYPEGGTEMLVMLALADWCNDSGGRLYPSVRGLANKARISSRQAQRTLRKIEADGWLSIVGNFEGGRTSRNYQINVIKLEECALYVTPDVDVTPDTSVTPTPDVDVTPPLTPMSPEPLMNLQEEPLKLNRADALKKFDCFWNEYPKKVGKESAKKSWLKIKMSDDLFDSIIRALKNQVPTFKPDFTLNPTTWLNGKRWEDEGFATIEKKHQSTINNLSKAPIKKEISESAKRIHAEWLAKQQGVAQ